jgi:hypothetical protein
MSVVQDKENWLLILKNNAKKQFLVLWVKRENYSWPEGRKKLDHPDLVHGYQRFGGTYRFRQHERVTMRM